MIVNTKIERGLVYIGESRKNFTNGRYYELIEPFSYFSIRDNCGSSKLYIIIDARDDIWFKENFKLMKKKEYILWSRSVKLRRLYECW